MLHERIIKHISRLLIAISEEYEIIDNKIYDFHCTLTNGNMPELNGHWLAAYGLT